VVTPYQSNAVMQTDIVAPQQETIHNPHYQEYLKLKDKQWMFSDLLPMDKEKTILTSNQQKLKILNLLYHLYNTAAEALHAFYIERKPELFDAHVGEASCQIRAIRLAIILKQTNLKTSTHAFSKSKIYKAKAKKIFSLMTKYSIKNNQVEGNKVLATFISSYCIDNLMNSETHFLLMSFILCRFKKVLTTHHDIIDIKKLTTAWNVSKNQARKIITLYQKKSSFHNIDYVFKNFHGTPQEHKLFGYLIQKDQINRWVLPCLESTRWLMSQCKLYSIPLLIQLTIQGKTGEKINNLYYKNNKLITNYPFHQSSLARPRVKIDAFCQPSDLPSCISSIELSDVLLANASSHFQYPCRSLAHKSINPYNGLNNYFSKEWLDSRLSNLRNFQANAIARGLCKRYPSNAAITHISCDTF